MRDGERERIGRAKSVPDDEYKAVYADIEKCMTESIHELAAKAGAEDD